MIRLKNVKLERKLLATLLKSKSASLKVLPRLSKELFSDKNFRQIFTSIKNYWATYTTVPKRNAVLEGLTNLGVPEKELERYEMVLDKILLMEFDKQDASYYTDKLVKSYQSRKTLKVIYDTADLIEQGKVDNAITHAQLQLSKLQNKGHINENLDGEYLEDFAERKKIMLDKIANPDKYRGVPTGIKVFDDYYGGMLPQELGVIISGTGKGKSITLMNFAVSAWLKGYAVVYVTIEMSKLECQFRIDSRIASVLHRKYRKGSLDKDELAKWEEKMKSLREKIDQPFYIIDVPEGCSVDFIEMKLVQLQDSLPKNFVLFVDYLNIMQSKTSKRMDDWLMQGEIAREMKVMLRSWNIPGWTAAQTKAKKAGGSGGSAEDVGRSYGIPQNANFVVGLFQSKEDELDGIMRMTSLKGRDGKFPEIILHPNFERMRIDLSIQSSKPVKKAGKDDK